MAKKKQDTTRLLQIEQAREEHERTERRRRLTLVAVCVLVGLVVVGAAAWVPVGNWMDRRDAKAFPALGVPAAQAGLSAVQNDSSAGINDHRPTGEVIAYRTVPPSAGPHWAQPASFSRKFYDARDRPAIETLVHNLEHGYTVVWYDDTIADDPAQLAALRNIARRYESTEFDNARKLVVAPWKRGEGAFPAGKHLAFTHWSTAAGRRQYAAKVSGQAIARFMRKFPATDSPEPQGP
ncbi:DUF3105 domain-containing protein [Actinopolymorpha singaporensis]|uniref:DUF3105 domain-containing protein n=1 Tax=Actinopolymorpha singaporensis TaxID=117157 RepID=A0A1H1SUV7_9ACTN|nr:DUF3105 domain-containing protein [Actinopolymorpha singaporensis]SDS51516.1 Protein of unknown function [Actinopolymorpha singaporensis]